MKTVIQFINFVFLFFISLNTYSQWQICGNYTGNVLSFAVIDSVLIAGTYGSGAYYTTDGLNWTYSTTGMTDQKIISMTKSGNNIFAGSETGGVYLSTDKGIIWSPVNNGLTSYEIHTMCSNSGNVYAGNNSGVYITSDNGSNWIKISTPSVGSTIFAVTAYDNKIFAASANGIFMTSNGGTSWNNISSGTTGYIYCLTKFNGIVYAGSSTSGVFKTTNDGQNWIQLNSGLPYGKAVRTVFCENDKTYAAVYNSGGVYYIPSGGITWIAANQGLTQLTSYSVITFNSNVYVGTTSGIFRRPKSEFSSINKINEYIPSEFKLFNNYPNPFNSQTKIRFSIPSGFGNDYVNLELYNISGKLIKSLYSNKLSGGIYELSFNAGDLASGCYFLKFSCEKKLIVGKIMLIK